MFSVQVDQYYNAVQIFASHYDALKVAYRHLPKHADWPEDFSCLSESATQFLVMCSSSLSYMGTTNIFADAPYPELGGLTDDLHRFAFYTCFCFQWNLFENFVKDSVLRLADQNLLAPPVAKDVYEKRFKTEGFLKYIESGNVFGHSPFRTVLPVTGWVPATESCNYSDLDDIRNLRNDLVHRVKGGSILKTNVTQERFYERSMWILRLFAGNIDQDVQRIRIGGLSP